MKYRFTLARMLINGWFHGAVAMDHDRRRLGIPSFLK